MAKTAMTYNGEGRVGAQRFDNCVVETGSLQYARFDGGYFDGDGMAHYLVPDFQGNTAMDIDELCNVVQETHYYPYGEPWSQPQGQPWLFGGKEREQRHHLGDSDFGARTYNAARASFAQPDPLAEKYYPITPYAYCAADPVNHIDPSGMAHYLSRLDGSYLGCDQNSNTENDYRLIEADFYTNITNADISNEEMIYSLSMNSSLIQIDEEEIVSSVKSIVSSTVDDGLEHQLFISLDTYKSALSIQLGPVGIRDRTLINTREIVSLDIQLAEDNYRNTPPFTILIGQIHTHPSADSTNGETLSEASALDAETAKSLGISIFAVDAFGEQRVHQVSPHGSVFNSIGNLNGGTNYFNSFGIEVLRQYKR